MPLLPIFLAVFLAALGVALIFYSRYLRRTKLPDQRRVFHDVDKDFAPQRKPFDQAASLFRWAVICFAGAAFMIVFEVRALIK